MLTNTNVYSIKFSDAVADEYDDVHSTASISMFIPIAFYPIINIVIIITPFTHLSLSPS